ncbi:MAG TPA: protein kinase [Gemmatimonadales bacterium]
MPPRTMATSAVEVSKVRSALGTRYKVERIVGEGGMATVYLAEDLKHHRRVAVKVMRPELAATLGADRFLREVEIAAQLSHPHILPMYDSGEVDGLLYYVMPYIEGESLHARLKREGQLQVEEAVRLAREVAEALAHAHDRGIIHRDIKPANILLSAGHALVADFGIARAVGAGATALTNTGLAVGTPQYMSPEQATGARDVDARADVYAVGAILYEMIAGEPPFTGPTPQAVVARSLTETPRPLTATRENLPVQVGAVAMRALAKSPADRYPTAAALADALTASLQSSRSGAMAPAAVVAQGPAPALVWGLFAIGSVAGLAVVIVLMRRWGLPIWALGLAIALLGVGAVVLVMTGRAEHRRRLGQATPGVQRWLTWTNAAMGGALALGLWAAVSTVFAVRTPGGSDGGGVRLAVLPFELRGATENAYLADGIADEIRGKLTGLPGFRVTARSSSDQYRETTKSLQQIGRELGVEYVLTATVRLVPGAGGTDRLQVVPELIATRTGEATWQQTFDASMTDVFQVQGQIASRVAGALGIALGGDEQRQLAERPTDNLAAWDLYQQGRALTGGDPATLRQQAGFFDQAAALDTAFAEAWADLGITLSRLYFMGTPDPSVGARAREAGEQAIAADPEGARGQAAMAEYFRQVARDPVQAEEHMLKALRSAPNDPEILTAAAYLEQTLGRWDDALTHLERARRLDPRSFETAGQLRNVLLYLRRYPEALEVGNDALALAPTSPANILNQVMIYLAQGDLPGARAVIRATPGSLGQPALVAFLATYQDLYWVLDDAQQRLLLRLPPSAFFDDPAAWGSVFMQTYGIRGDKARARAYADTARMAFEAQIRDAPDDPQLHVLNGLALAYMGRKDEAIAEGERGVALLPITRDARSGTYYQHQLVRIYLMVGEQEKALDKLEPLLRVPYYLSPGWLRIDPAFQVLKGNPRFERLLGTDS